MATSSPHLIDGVPAMPQPNDLSRPLVALDQNSTIIAVIEMSCFVTQTRSRRGWLRGYGRGMALLRYRRHRFPPEIIQHAIWLYLRFTLSYRDVEELLAVRGLDISYETVRRWVLKFGPAIARRLRQRRPRPSDRGHLDEMVVRIAGERTYLWRAVDDEGEVLDMLVQRQRDARSALRLVRKLLKKQGFVPKIVVTDKLRSYACAFQRLRLTCRHEQEL